MKIDITQPQPCPVCGAEMGKGHYSDEDDLYWCTNVLCGLHDATLTLHELNRLSLLARLGEVATIKVSLRKDRMAQAWENGSPWPEFDPAYDVFLNCVGRELAQEFDAILAALGKLESAQ